MCLSLCPNVYNINVEVTDNLSTGDGILKSCTCDLLLLWLEVHPVVIVLQISYRICKANGSTEDLECLCVAC